MDKMTKVLIHQLINPNTKCTHASRAQTISNECVYILDIVDNVIQSNNW